MTETKTNAYAMAREYRAAIQMTDHTKDFDIERDLEAISRYIDKRLDRFFTKDHIPVTRTYIIPATSPRLYVDDMAEAPSAVTINGANLPSNSYDLWPLNAALEPEPRAYIRLDLIPQGSIPFFKKGDRVEVTARFGWPAVPAAIKSATIQLTAILRLESPRATQRISELGEAAVEASPDAQIIVRQLIDQYRRVHYV